MKIKKTFIFLFQLLLLTSLAAQAEGYKYLCNSEKAAESAKQILESKKFFIDFCSSCDPQKASLRRVEVSSVNIAQSDCGFELNVKGKLTRGIKPPISGGECTDKLEIYTPSIPLALEYDKKIDLAYSYVFDPNTKTFKTLAELVGLNVKEVCIKQIVIKR